MWTSDGQLIQIEYGKAIMDLTTERDDRSVLDKAMGWSVGLSLDIGSIRGKIDESKRYEPCQMLYTNIGLLRAALEQKGIHLPIVEHHHLVDQNIDSTLPADTARIYFGIEIAQCRVRQLKDIMDVLFHKALEYSRQHPSTRSVGPLLEASADNAKSGDYAAAMQKVCLSYYFAKLQAEEMERIVALGYGGTYSLRNSDFRHAYAYIAAASSAVNSSNIFPAEMRTSISLDAGNTLRVWADRQANKEQANSIYNTAAQYFQAAISTADTSNDITRLFFGLCGLSGITYILNDLRTTDSLISRAIDLVSDKTEKEYLKDFLLEVRRLDRDRVLAENTRLKGMIKEMEVELKRQRFVNQIGKLALQLIIAPSINAVLSGMGLLGVTIRVTKCRFEGPAQIGYNNYRQMLQV